MEKKIEELKGMTQEELVVMIQSLEEERKKATENSNYWYNKYDECTKKYENLKNVLNGIVSMI